MTMQKQEVLQTTKFGIAINKWRILMMIVFAILACSGIICSIISGAVAIPISELKNIFIDGVNSPHQQILYNIRLPRTIVAGLVGMNLAMAGAILQAVMKNPLADPHIIGISSGAGLTGILVIVLFPAMEYLITPIAFCWCYDCSYLHLFIGMEKWYKTVAYYFSRGGSISIFRCRYFRYFSFI